MFTSAMSTPGAFTYWSEPTTMASLERGYRLYDIAIVFVRCTTGNIFAIAVRVSDTLGEFPSSWRFDVSGKQTLLYNWHNMLNI